MYINSTVYCTCIRFLFYGTVTNPVREKIELNLRILYVGHKTKVYEGGDRFLQGVQSPHEDILLQYQIKDGLPKQNIFYLNM